MPGRGRSLALPPLTEKQKDLCRCKQAINKDSGDFFVHQTGKIYITCSDIWLLHALSWFFPPVRPGEVLRELLNLITHGLCWVTGLRKAAIKCHDKLHSTWQDLAAQRDPLTHHWHAALLHCSCIRVQATFLQNHRKEMEHPSVNPPGHLPASPVRVPAPPHTIKQQESCDTTEWPLPTSVARNATQH